MATYFTLHTLKKSADEVMKALGEGAPEMAKSMAEGQTPAKCIKTWNPLPHGRYNYMFCLWEADNAEDVETTIQSVGFAEYITNDIMQVDEIDWGEVAKGGG